MGTFYKLPLLHVWNPLLASCHPKAPCHSQSTIKSSTSETQALYSGFRASADCIIELQHAAIADIIHKAVIISLGMALVRQAPSFPLHMDAFAGIQLPDPPSVNFMYWLKHVTPVSARRCTGIVLPVAMTCLHVAGSAH